MPHASIALTSACRPPYFLMPALAEHLTVAHHHRPDHRVGLDGADALAGELDGT